MRNFRNLQVGQKAHSLTLKVYKATASFPREELYGLTSQMRRASGSVPANIAEGYGRKGPAEFARFLNMALGSASELEYHLLLAHELNYLGLPLYERLAKDAVEVKRMLTGLLKSLKAEG